MTYFFILPLSLAFTIEFSFNVLGLDVYRPEAGNYYSTVIWMTFAVGLAFQFPLVLLLLIRIGIINVLKLRKSRRFVLVILMISAALITPGGDPVSLCILTIPLYFLFELSILLGSLIERKAGTVSQTENNSTGIAGSVFLLLCLLVLGAIGAWLYLNWEKAESIFLNLPAVRESTELPKQTLPASKDFPHLKHQDSFLLELYPIGLNDGNNSSELPQAKIYRAKVRQ